MAIVAVAVFTALAFGGVLAGLQALETLGKSFFRA
jgi:hypothetical protein